MEGSPLSIFAIYYLIEFKSYLLHFNFSLTNNSFYLLISLLILVIILYTTIEYTGNKLIPSNLNLVGESLHNSVLVMARQTAAYQTMFPLLLSLFGLILMANLLSNIPYNYASTSALTFALGLSMTVFIGVTLLAITIKGWVYLASFVPGGTPGALLPPLIFIELISYSARSVSLGVRLFANMVAGHTLLNIISSMIKKMLSKYFSLIIIIAIPMSILIAVVGLEAAVAVIQAYVFSILTAIYVNEAIKPLI